MAKKWQITGNFNADNISADEIVRFLLKSRGLAKKKDSKQFLAPSDPDLLNASDVGIDEKSLQVAIERIRIAIEKKESVVVYADYDADGITAGTILWETLHSLGARVMPYIPHRVEEGYGLSVKGIDAIIVQYRPSLIITVDHGITGREKVAYAKSLRVDVIVTDHHEKPVSAAGGPDALPDCTIVHTTKLCGAGVSWFVSKELLKSYGNRTQAVSGKELLAMAAIGTIADMMPLIGANRSIVKFGLAAINETGRVGLRALISESGLTPGMITPYDVSHVLAPRLNAMGRLVHAMDALRLLCTHRQEKAMMLAQKLSLTNKERQQMTLDTTQHALEFVRTAYAPRQKKLLFVAHESYNQGIIGLVAGKLVEEHYLPSVVLSRGELISKASARSIAGFNIVAALRSCSDLLVDVGGHPMAAGFTVETKNLDLLKGRLEKLADELGEDALLRVLRVDMEIPLASATEALWARLQDFEPFGFGNPEPVFVTRRVRADDARIVGNGNKHLKLRITDAESRNSRDAIAFNLGGLYGKLRPEVPVDIAYSLDMNTWNGRTKLQLKIKDIQLQSS